MQNIKRTFQSQRQDQSWLLNPLRRDDVPMLLKQFQMTKNEEKLFLLHDSGLGDQQWIFVCYFTRHLSSWRTRTLVCGWLLLGLPGKILSNLHSACSYEWPNILCAYGRLAIKIENICSWFLLEVVNHVRNVGNDLEDILINFERAAINSQSNAKRQCMCTITWLFYTRVVVWY